MTQPPNTNTGATIAIGQRCWMDPADLAVYALEALDPPTASRIEEHLLGCAFCAAEIEWMLPIVALLHRARPTPARALADAPDGVEFPASVEGRS